MKIVVIGEGIVGKSLALELRSKGICSEVTSVCNNKDTCGGDIELLIGTKSGISEQTKEIFYSDVIILDIPLALSLKYLSSFLSLVGEYTVLMDVGSSKVAISKCAKKHKRRGHFVPTHPIIEYSTEVPFSFQNKTAAICAGDSALFAVERIAELYESLNMKTLFLKEEEHDKLIAHSQTFRILSYVLSSVAVENKKQLPNLMELSSPDFLYALRSGTGTPELWTSILEDNQKNISTVLRNHIKHLTSFKKDIEGKRTKKIHQSIQQATANKNNIK